MHSEPWPPPNRACRLTGLFCYVILCVWKMRNTLWRGGGTTRTIHATGSCGRLPGSGLDGVDFRPRISWLGDSRPPAAACRGRTCVLPCFRQRDALAPAGVRRRNVPLLFDLWSARTPSRCSNGASSPRQRAGGTDPVPGGTAVRRGRPAAGRYPGFAESFAETFAISPARIHVVPIGARNRCSAVRGSEPSDAPFEVLFYGSFLASHGAEIVARQPVNTRARRSAGTSWAKELHVPPASRSQPVGRMCRSRLEAVRRTSGDHQSFRRGAGIFGTTPAGGTRVSQQGVPALAAASVLTRTRAYPDDAEHPAA